MVVMRTANATMVLVIVTKVTRGPTARWDLAQMIAVETDNAWITFNVNAVPVIRAMIARFVPVLRNVPVTVSASMERVFVITDLQDTTVLSVVVQMIVMGKGGV